MGRRCQTVGENKFSFSVEKTVMVLIFVSLYVKLSCKTILHNLDNNYFVSVKAK